MTEAQVWDFAQTAAFRLGAFVMSTGLLILMFLWAAARMREASKP